ncbi:uncharacterized protein LOC141908427 [Tubulanus polymorphus]|uniref:uncharacterized protein LOC141908427 n=1 Tax=Tubulanus polymorphus TaxID=672921 RepID=UPI003DA39691
MCMASAGAAEVRENFDQKFDRDVVERLLDIDTGGAVASEESKDLLDSALKSGGGGARDPEGKELFVTGWVSVPSKKPGTRIRRHETGSKVAPRESTYHGYQQKEKPIEFEFKYYSDSRGYIVQYRREHASRDIAATSSQSSFHHHRTDAETVAPSSLHQRSSTTVAVKLDPVYDNTKNRLISVEQLYNRASPSPVLTNRGDFNFSMYSGLFKVPTSNASKFDSPRDYYNFSTRDRPASGHVVNSPSGSKSASRLNSAKRRKKLKPPSTPSAGWRHHQRTFPEYPQPAVATYSQNNELIKQTVAQQQQVPSYSVFQGCKPIKNNQQSTNNCLTLSHRQQVDKYSAQGKPLNQDFVLHPSKMSTLQTLTKLISNQQYNKVVVNDSASDSSSETSVISKTSHDPKHVISFSSTEPQPASSSRSPQPTSSSSLRLNQQLSLADFLEASIKEIERVSDENKENSIRKEYCQPPTVVPKLDEVDSPSVAGGNRTLSPTVSNSIHNVYNDNTINSASDVFSKSSSGFSLKSDSDRNQFELNCKYLLSRNVGAVHQPVTVVQSSSSSKTTAKKKHQPQQHETSTIAGYRSLSNPLQQFWRSSAISGLKLGPRTRTNIDGVAGMGSRRITPRTVSSVTGSSSSLIPGAPSKSAVLHYYLYLTIVIRFYCE